MNKLLLFFILISASLTSLGQKNEITIDGKTYILKDKEKEKTPKFDTLHKWEINLSAGLSCNTITGDIINEYKLKPNFTILVGCLYNLGKALQIGLRIDATQLAVYFPKSLTDNNGNNIGSINVKYFTANPAVTIYGEVKRNTQINGKIHFGYGFILGYTEGQKLDKQMTGIQDIQNKTSQEIKFAGNNSTAIQKIISDEKAKLLALNRKEKIGALANTSGVSFGITVSSYYSLTKNTALILDLSPRYYHLKQNNRVGLYALENLNCLALPITLGVSCRF